jgi:hypothetical protein
MNGYRSFQLYEARNGRVHPLFPNDRNLGSATRSLVQGIWVSRLNGDEVSEIQRFLCRAFPEYG